MKERALAGTDEKTAYRFLGELEKRGISATLRRRTGAEIGGACGQLRAARLAAGGQGNAPAAENRAPSAEKSEKD